MSRIAAALLILGLAACGQRGPLVLPPGPPPTPLIDRVLAPGAPAEPAKPAANEGDGSTDSLPASR